MATTGLLSCYERAGKATHERRPMSERLTLAQISDVHLAPITGLTPRYWNLKRALGGINWLWGRKAVHQRRVADLLAADIVKEAPDHIAVTGDLANLGLPEEYKTALGWLRTLGLPERVTVIPGNHDIYTSRMHGASCLVDWAPYMSSIGWEANSGAQAAAQFPFVRKLGSVALIGLNSAVPTPPFVASGRLGREQLAALGTVLDETRKRGLTRVVLIHHPPLPGQAKARRGLEDAETLSAVLAQHGAELVLHGHNHRDMMAWHPSAGGAIPIVGIASGSAAIAHKREPTARYTIFNIGHEGGRLRIFKRTRGLDAAGTSVVELSRCELSAPRSV